MSSSGKAAGGFGVASMPQARLLRSGVYAPLFPSYAGPNAQILGPGTMALMPFVLAKAVTLNAIGINVVTLAAASVVRLGLYADDGTGLPGALIAELGTVDTSTTGLKELAINQALPAGALLWAAYVSQGGAPFVTVLNTTITTSAHGLGFASASLAATGGDNALMQLAAAGALPASAAGATFTGGSVPMIYARAA